MKLMATEECWSKSESRGFEKFEERQVVGRERGSEPKSSFLISEGVNEKLTEEEDTKN